MVKKKISEFNHNIVPSDDADGTLNLFDLNNPDINLFNAVDDELIKVSGSKILVYTYEHDEGYDDLFDERRSKTINPYPKVVWGHYDPRALEENLTEFGIEITNDQVFTFNKAYLEAALNRPLRAGDIVKPAFQNIFYEVFEVQEDNFAAYGVFHLLASAKVLREAPEVFPEGHVPEISVKPKPRDYVPYEASEGYRLKTDVTAWEDTQIEFINKNARSLMFTRDVPKSYRDNFVLESENGRKGLYTSFSTVLKAEREKYGQGIDQFLASADDGSLYTTDHINTNGVLGENEFLAKFWETAWLEARWNLIPGTASDPTLKHSGLDYVFMDLCNLYPTEYYIGDKNNPLDTSGAWREAMINSVKWVRERLDASIGLVVNCIRSHVGISGYTADPTQFYSIDGTDLITAGGANAGVMECVYDWDAASPKKQQWQNDLRTILRCAQENKTCYTSWVAKPDELQRRLNNLASFYLVHEHGLTEFANVPQDPSPIPLPAYPENNLDLGRPLQSAHPFFEAKDITEEKVFTRDFSNGYSVVFNFTLEAITVPAKYSSYKKAVLNADIVLNTDGSTNGAIMWDEIGDITLKTISSFHGLLLKSPSTPEINTFHIPVDK